MRNNINKSLTTLISLFFIISSFLGSVHFWCFNESFYTNEHNQIMLYGKHINEHIGISNEQLKELTSFTLDYLNHSDSSLDLKMEIKGELREVYNDEEKLHMVDVRTLNLYANYILIISIIVLLISIILFIIEKCRISELYFRYKTILKYFIFGFLIIGLWILIDFDSFWIFFHHIFFAGNDLWLLNLRKDILIMIVPPEFFNHLVIRICATFVFILFVSYFLLKYLSRKKIMND